MEAVKESARLVMEPENKAALEQVAQEIIGIQTAVLELHKAKQQRSVTAADYTAQISEYSQQMRPLIEKDIAETEKILTTSNLSV